MVAAIVQESNLDTIQTCVNDAGSIVPQIVKLVGDIKGGHMIKAAKLARKIFVEIPTTLSACKAICLQLKELERWATIFEHLKTVVEDTTKSLVFKNKQIETDFTTAKTDWSA